MKDGRDMELDKLSEIDLVYQILRQKGEPTYYRELIEEVFKLKSITPANWAQAVSAIYTQINLDPRFTYAGDGCWGLKSWFPNKNTRRLPLATFLHKTIDYDSQMRIKNKAGKLEDGLGEAGYDIEFRTTLESSEYYGDDEDEWEG